MLLLDVSGIMVQNCLALHKVTECEKELAQQLKSFRHVAMTSILQYKRKYGKTYGAPVLCVDRKPYWRESVHEFYKKNRNKSKTDYGDWAAFGKNFKLVQEDMDAYMPYPFIEVPRCEGDDSMTVLTQYAHARHEPTMVVSSDKDMLQLQKKYKQVKQFSPKLRKLISPDDEDKDYSLLTHCIRGDSSDGIPNIFSPNDILMFPGTGLRQRVVSAKMLTAAHSHDDPFDWDELDDESKYKLKRNILLIDTGKIPARLKDRIVDKYEAETATRKPNRVKQCAIDYRMRNLLPFAKDF